jgi:F0F1-type ATP synthase assembly protein I
MDKLNEIQKQRSKTAYFVIVGMSTAILLATPVIVLAGAGFLLDKLFNTSPILVLIGGVVGFISGMVNIYKLLMKMNKK